MNINIEALVRAYERGMIDANDLKKGVEMWGVETWSRKKSNHESGLQCNCDECRGLAQSAMSPQQAAAVNIGATPGYGFPPNHHIDPYYPLAMARRESEGSPPLPSPEMQVWVLMQRAMSAFKEAGWTGEETVATLERLLNNARAVAEMSKPAKSEEAGKLAPFSSSAASGSR